MNKSIKKPVNRIKKSIKVNSSGSNDKNKKKNDIRYLKQRYALHYRKANWQRADEYNQYSMSNYQFDLRDWMESKEISKMKNKNSFGFSNAKKIRYG